LLRRRIAVNAGFVIPQSTPQPLFHEFQESRH
jgi:hypothetical protein